MKTDEVGVTNWFTKKFERPSRSGSEIASELFNEIVERSVKLRMGDISGFAEIVWTVVSAADEGNKRLISLHEDLMKFCADTRLPVCSLFHHMKNTAAIAVVLAYDLGYEQDQIQLFRVAALLHDVGKLYAPGKGKEHVVQTEKFLKNLLGRVEALDANQKRNLVRLSTKHHSTPWYDEYIATHEDEKILSLADSIASATDRRYEIVLENFSMSKNDFKQGREVKVKIRSDDLIFPHRLRFGEPSNFKCKEFNEYELGRKEEKEFTLVPLPSEGTINQVLLFFDKTVNGGIIAPFLEQASVGTMFECRRKIGLFALDIQGIQQFVRSAKKLPTLRGGSAIVDDVLEEAKKVLSEEFSPETVLFSGGGNLVALVPPREEKLKELKEKINKIASVLSANGLRVAVSYSFEDIFRIEREFGQCLSDLFKNIENEKNFPVEKDAIVPERSKRICAHCSDGLGVIKLENGEQVCEKCFEKSKRGKELREELEPRTLEDIAETIAVVVLDGNMMGRLLTQTKTPAEYSYKSETFDTQMKVLLEETLDEIEHRSPWLKKGETVKYKKIYAGGDDVFLIIDSRAAIDFAESFIEKVAHKMSFEGERPTVTFSAGIAISDKKFPIYFLIDKAYSLLGLAKKEFRKCVELDEKKLFKLPKGAIALSVVTSSMPSEDDFAFVLPRDKDKLILLKKFLYRAISSDDWRPLISLLVNSERGDESKLNFVKYLYARALAKESIIRIAESENMEILAVIKELIEGWKLKEELENLVPMMWYFKEGGH